MINEKLHLIIGELSEFGVVTSFNGSFTQGIIEEIGEALKVYITNEKSDYDRTRVYDIFSVYIEQAQNIKNYFTKKALCENKEDIHKFEHESIIVIGEEKAGYYVCSGNHVENNDINPLKQMIDYVNSISKDELKKFYKEKLREKKEGAKSGGLGIIDMARKSSKPLEYLFVGRDERYSFFTLKVVI